jgi:hypothetical protein
MDFEIPVVVQLNLSLLRAIAIRLGVFSSFTPTTFPAQTDIAAEKAPISQ